MTDQDVVAQAMEFANKAHEGQVRRDARQVPYITHVAEVVELVQQSGGTQLEIAGAWLHDTVEHTTTTLDDIKALFGDEVWQLINELTDPVEFKDLSVAECKDKQALRVHGQSASAKRVKIADQISNVRLVGSGVLLDTDPLESVDYIVGAKKVADACAGVSQQLEKLFTEAFEAGMGRYRHI